MKVPVWYAITRQYMFVFRPHSSHTNELCSQSFHNIFHSLTNMEITTLQVNLFDATSWLLQFLFLASFLLASRWLRMYSCTCVVHAFSLGYRCCSYYSPCCVRNLAHVPL